jgi:hypothetical protein
MGAEQVEVNSTAGAMNSVTDPGSANCHALGEATSILCKLALNVLEQKSRIYLLKDDVYVIENMV